jgi:hypothetical protein
MIKFQFKIKNKHRQMKQSGLLFLLFILSISATSCFSVKYSMSGASISPEVKTLSIQYFSDRSPSGQPAFSQQFTTAMIDKCRSQTSLIIIANGGDVAFEGEITGFDPQSTAIQGNDQAAKIRLTITVHVKFTNAVDPKLNFDSNFSRFEDYPASQSADQAYKTIFPKIIDELTEDIFNKAFANW